MAIASVFRTLLLLACLLLTQASPAADAATAAPALDLPAPGQLHVYVREGCPHCAEAKRFLAGLAGSRPGLQVVLREVDRDSAARDALMAISEAVGAWPPGVPTFVYGDRVLVGFDDAEHVGAELLRLLDEAPPLPRDRVESSLFGTLSASELGLPLFTLTLGLLDGFNPCAMWVLLFLLSLLVRLQDRRRMAMVAGTFVLASGAVYYAFMAAWLNVFLLVGMTAALRVGLAVLAMLIGLINVKDFFAFRRGVSLSIPASAKPGIYARARANLKAESLPASLVAVAAHPIAYARHRLGHLNMTERLWTPRGLPSAATTRFRSSPKSVSPRRRTRSRAPDATPEMSTPCSAPRRTCSGPIPRWRSRSRTRSASTASAST